MIDYKPRIRYLRPTLWTFAVAGTFYLGFAAYDVYNDVRKLKTRRRRSFVEAPITWEDVQAGKSTSMIRDVFSRQARDPITLEDFRHPSTLPALWNQFLGPEKLMYGAIALNTSLYGLSQLFPRFALSLMHVPAVSRNYTLLTSTFGHASLLHLGLNMYGLYNFAFPVAASKSFQGSGAHLGAFYLSSGVFAALAYHVTAGWPARHLRLTPGLGASGAILALVGAFAMEYPQAKIGIIFLPFLSLPAQELLAAFAAFEAYGLFVGIRSIRFAHAAHLAGMAIGAGYVYLDGRNRLWNPARKVAFQQMQATGII